MLTRNYISLFFLSLIFISCGTKHKKVDDSLVLERDTTVIVPMSVSALMLDSNDFSVFFKRHPEYLMDSVKLRTFYLRRSMQYAWLNDEGINEQAGSFINQLLHLADEGLPADTLIPVEAFQQLANGIPVKEMLANNKDETLADLEFRLTLSFFRYANRVWGGVASRDLRDFEWFIQRKPIDDVQLLDSMLMNAGDFFQHEPVYEQYGFLKNQLRFHRDLEKNTKWDTIICRQKELVKGSTDSCIALVKLRLRYLNDFKEQDSSLLFTDSLESALINFQRRFGLTMSGKLNATVLKELNVNLEERIKQIMINMERCRWVPSGKASDYIAINIPEFKMHVFENGKDVWSMNVVVGTEATQTVIFNGMLSTIVFSPYWNVPASIIEKEILPALRKNPGYLAAHQMEAIRPADPSSPINPQSVKWSKFTGYNLPYIIRQKPGPANSLGLVKFLFPNSYSIYLHDSPARHLFDKTDRSFSHGCIRLSEPAKFAEYLLRNDSIWNTSKITAAMKSGSEKFVKLKKKLPVFIAYFTCWVDADGQLNFRKDIYGHDKRLGEFLFAPANVTSAL
ncbi:L,D-transpeptidase family protein [soil metagenome]